MNDEIWAYLGLSTESVCGHSTNTVPNATSSLLQGPPVLEDEWANAWPPRPDNPAPIHYSQIKVEARYLIDYCTVFVYQLTRIFRHYPLAFIHHRCLLFGL